MATKIDRVEARVAHDQRERIEQAAKLTNTSLSSFMVTAAQEKAERVFAERRTTLVPADFFDSLVAALDEPGAPLPRLTKAAENARTIVTHRQSLFFAEAIRADHQLDAFTCGKPALDTWLRHDALRTHKLGTARTTVWVTADHAVIAYYALAGHSLNRADLPKPSQRNMPAAIPAVLIAKMALSQTLHGHGHGEDLLLDALNEALRGMQKVGGHYIVVDAIDDEAAAFYRHYDFTSIPDNDRRLLLRAADAAASLGVAWPQHGEGVNDLGQQAGAETDARVTL